MKTLFLQLAAISSAFVLPNQDVLAEVQIHTSEVAESLLEKLPSSDSIVNKADEGFNDVAGQVRDAYRKFKCHAFQSIDDALIVAADTTSTSAQEFSDGYFDPQAWVDTEPDDVVTADPFGFFKRSASNGEGLADDHDDKAHHGHKKSNETVYQLIAKSKYTTKLAKLINDYPDLVDTLNKTDAHYTVFAPTDQAFDKIPEHAPKPTKEQIEKILLYHVSPDFYPAGRVLVTRTIPTFLQSDNLAKKPVAQRLGTEISFRGLTVNYYSRIVAVNIFGSNGVIHGVDSLILPPPPALKIIDLLPEEFSTLELGLFKTGLFTTINDTESEHTGGTLFAPANYAFQKLGVRVNAFLFSPPGLKYLKALLEYHIVLEQTLYSDHYTDGRSSEESSLTARGPPRGYKHFDLDTALEGKYLAVDVSRYGRLIDIQINGYTHVIRADGVAKDGVVHEINNVLIPPHPHDHEDGAMWDGESEMSVKELVQRLDPLIGNGAAPDEL